MLGAAGEGGAPLGGSPASRTDLKDQLGILVTSVRVLLGSPDTTPSDWGKGKQLVPAEVSRNPRQQIEERTR